MALIRYPHAYDHACVTRLVHFKYTLCYHCLLHFQDITVPQKRKLIDFSKITYMISPIYFITFNYLRADGIASVFIIVNSWENERTSYFIYERRSLLHST